VTDADAHPDARNVLLILSDEHRPDAAGYAGHDLVETPALDGLAAAGTRFSNAYCPSPLCAPCRGSLTTGRYVHEVGTWDNAASYDGSGPNWPSHCSTRGVHTASVGKLDFQPGVEVFDEQLLPNYRGSPDVNGLERDPPNVRENARDRILAAGPSEEPGAHERGDAERTDRAVEWLETRASDDPDDPWVLSVNYTLPHFPLTAVRDYYDRYPESAVDLPVDYPAADDHPILEELRDHFDGREVPEPVLRRTRAAYYALCTELDDNVGRLLDALDRTGLAEETLVVYSSDHGEPLGDHATWWKCNMYEPAAGVPLLVRGPGVRTGVAGTPVSLLDVVPTLASTVGVEPDPGWQGRSLRPALRGEPFERRPVLSEYHAHGTSRGAFMLRDGRYKYVHYPGDGIPDQLFDRERDPEELENLAADPDPEHAAVLDRLRGTLTDRVDPDPETVDRRARADQRERRERPVEEWWGVADAGD